MTAESTPPTPTLPATWTPTGYGCRRDDDIWIWDYHFSKDMRTVMGGPSQTETPDQCFPSTWATLYAGTECPREFTTACPPANSNEPVTCCPTAFSFSCVSTANRNPHGATFPCMSQYNTSRTIKVTRTDFIESTITVGEVAQKTNLHLFALGVVYTTLAANSHSDAEPTVSSPSFNASETPPPGHSTIRASVAAGIGIGCGIGVIVLSSLVWFLCRRRKSSKVDVAQSAEHPAKVCVSEAKIKDAQPVELSGQTRRELEG